MSKDTNLLFKPAMVRSLLDGSKTMTRRLFSDKLRITEHPEHYKLITTGKGYDFDFPIGRKGIDERTYAGFQIVGGEHITEWLEPIEVPYAEVGDRIYVRETHYRYGKWLHRRDDTWTFVAYNDRVRFEDDAPKVLGNRHTETLAWHRRPALFMLKGHTRIILEVTKKKVERLHDISEEDAKREGCQIGIAPGTTRANLSCVNCGRIQRDHSGISFACNGVGGVFSPNTYKGGFAMLWESINGPGSWDANPWTVALVFKRVL